MKRRNGYTLIELVLVLLLLILIAAVVFTLAGVGSDTYLRLAAKQAQATDLRTGLSYLDVQIRKHDTRGALAIRPDPFAGKPALVIRQQIEGKDYLTWIYLYQGSLCELFVASGAKVTPDMGSLIVPMDDLQIEGVGDDAVRVTLSRQAKGQARIQGTRIIDLHAGGIVP
jgi:type II secretory pathway pseudopilin PulG